MAQITEYGKAVKKRLIDMEKTQVWLMGEIQNKTGRFCDNGYLQKILTGQRPARAIVAAINEILELTEAIPAGSTKITKVRVRRITPEMCRN